MIKLIITGTIESIDEIRFNKLKFAIAVVNEHESLEYYSIQLSEGYHNLIDGYKVGDEITVYVKLIGIKWPDRRRDRTLYFNNLECTNVENPN